MLRGNTGDAAGSGRKSPGHRRRSQGSGTHNRHRGRRAQATFLEAQGRSYQLRVRQQEGQLLNPTCRGLRGGWGTLQPGRGWELEAGAFLLQGVLLNLECAQGHEFGDALSHRFTYFFCPRLSRVPVTHTLHLLPLSLRLFCTPPPPRAVLFALPVWRFCCYPLERRDSHLVCVAFQPAPTGGVFSVTAFFCLRLFFVSSLGSHPAHTAHRFSRAAYFTHQSPARPAGSFQTPGLMMPASPCVRLLTFAVSSDCSPCLLCAL